MTLTPYYDHAGITIYHGDCREILPHVKADVMVTDPPYGIDYGKAGGFNASHGWGPWRENVKWDEARPDGSTFDLMLSLGLPMVVWGGNYFTDYLPPRMGWIGWDKGQRDFSLADFELAWTSEQNAARMIVFPRGRAILDGKCHPTQKPVWVMQQCIAYLDHTRKREHQTILDPFMGSGTTLVAAKQLGRKAIGIEIEERYCEIAVKRLRQEVLPGMGVP